MNFTPKTTGAPEVMDAGDSVVLFTHNTGLAKSGINFDVKWVASQVGHADSKMTLDVYAQL
jgi:hypothetical protein